VAASAVAASAVAASAAEAAVAAAAAVPASRKDLAAGAGAAAPRPAAAPNVVACMGLEGEACAAEGLGHAKALTCVTWLPCPDGGGGRPPRRGRLYHLVTGSRDGELRQW
jgi:hypothetical protein